MHYILILWITFNHGAAVVIENDDAATCISNGQLVLRTAKLTRKATPNGCFAKGGMALFVQEDVDAVEAFNASIPGN